MRFLKIFFSVIAGFITLTVVVYLVAGYFALGWAFEKFQARGQMKEHQTQVFSLEKNLTDDEKKQLEEFKKTLSKEDLADLESVKKEFAVPKIVKSKKKKKERKPVTPEDLQRMHEIDELITFADEIIKENRNFDPCSSLCGESPLRSLANASAEGGSEEGESGELPVVKPKVDFLKRIKEYYSQSEQQALKDPAFNYVVLFMADLRSVMPKEFSDFMMDVMSKDPKVIESDPWLKAKLLVQMPIWIYRIKEGVKKAENRHVITKNFFELHQSCKKGKVIKREAHRQCVELFDNYDFE